MKTYYLDGEKYYYDKGRWLTSRYMVVPTSKLSRLNKLLIAEEDLSSKTLEQLMAIIDGARNDNNNLFLAINAANRALEIADVRKIRYILPKVTSNYRRAGQPRKAVDIGEHYLTKHGDFIASGALYTSLAAAYCDLQDYVTARAYANKALKIEGDYRSDELKIVFSRIKTLEN